MDQPPHSMDFRRPTVNMVYGDPWPHPHQWRSGCSQTDRNKPMQHLRCHKHHTTSNDTMWGSKLIWNWTRARIAAITRTNSVDVPETWTIKPDFRICPPQRHKAIKWMIAHLVNYHMQGQRCKSLVDYIDFMRRARWKADSRTVQQKAVGNYLSILNPPSLWTTQTPQTRHALG